MKKILYIANYREGTGYSDAALGYIKSLDAVGFDVVARHIKMTNGRGDNLDFLDKFESKDTKNVDTVIYHSLPSEFAYKGGVKNIGMFAYETNNIAMTGWLENLKLMDEIVVFCNDQKKAIITSSPSINQDKIHVIGHATDINKYSKKYNKIDFNVADNCLIFYTICEWNPRKNMSALILSYFASFSRDDNVCLVIKTNNRQEAKNGIDHIKKMCGKYNNGDMYPEIVLISDRLSDEAVLGLHQSCDVYVSTSHGESWNIPCMDALGFGNLCIATNTGAFKDYLDAAGGISVDSYQSLAAGHGYNQNHLYSPYEQWDNISLPKLSNIFKSITNTKPYASLFSDDVRKKRSDFIKNNYSYQNIGNLLSKVI